MEKINNKFIKLLETMSKKEIDQFRKFISSPFITKGRNYLPYFENIINLKKSSVKVQKSGIFKTDLNMRKQTFRNRYSELYKLGEEFLIYNWLKKNKSERELILLKTLHEKNLFSHFKFSYNESMKKLNKRKFDKEKLKNISEIYGINSDYLIEIRKEEVLYNEYFKKSILNLCYFMISLYETGIEFCQQESVNIKFTPNYVTEYLKLLNVESLILKFRYSEDPLFKIVAMHYYLFIAIENLNKEEEYALSHKIFQEMFEDIDEYYKTQIFMFMINYCIRKFNTGDPKYRMELFTLYKEKLDQNLISDLKNKSYTFNHFRDYVLIGLELNELKWVDNFIEKYSVHLPDILKEDELKLSRAKLEFWKKNCKESLSFLSGIKTTHYLQYIDTAIFKLFNYYELEYFEESFSVINNFKQYFKNNKDIPKLHHIRNLNFLKVYNRLIKFRIGIKKEDAEFIKKEFENLKQITGKNWLTEKISEINK